MLLETAMDISTYTGALRRVILDRVRRAAITLPECSERAGFHRDYLGHCIKGVRPLTTTILTAIAPILSTTAGQIHREARALSDD